MALPLLAFGAGAVGSFLARIGLRAFLLTIVGSLVFRALFALGFAYVTFVGLDSLMDSLKIYVHGLFSALPFEVAHLLGLANVDIAINITFAAISARLLLVGMDKLTGRVSKLSLTK